MEPVLKCVVQLREFGSELKCIIKWESCGMWDPSALDSVGYVLITNYMYLVNSLTVKVRFYTAGSVNRLSV